MNGDSLEIIKHMDRKFGEVFREINGVKEGLVEKNHAQDRVLDNHATRIENNEKAVGETIPATFHRMNNELSVWKTRIAVIGLVVVVLVLVVIGVDKAAEVLKAIF
jgi:hypothetical protein